MLKRKQKKFGKASPEKFVEQQIEPPRSIDDFSDLSPRQLRFIDEYLILGNKVRAATNAGYSQRSAPACAFKEFLNPRVKQYYDFRIHQIHERSEANIAKVLVQLEEIAHSDIRDFIDEYGTMKQLDPKKMNTRLIQSIKNSQFGKQITLCSKEKALELLGRYYSMWKDNLDMTSNGHIMRELNVSFKEVTKETVNKEVK